MRARHALRRRRNLAGVSLLVITASILGALIGYQHTIPTQTDKRPIPAVPAAPITPTPKVKTLDSGNESTNSDTLQLAAATRRLRSCSPVARPYHISQGYSARHRGLDFAAPRGRLVRNATWGRVISVRHLRGSYGTHVLIRHGNGHVTLYAHLSSTHMRPGRLMAACWAVGRLGSTGNSTGPHLHFEARNGYGAQTSPASWLRVRGVRP